MRNENQSLAIEHFLGPCLVIAGPGSGKTKCLVERVDNLICAHNVSPDKILVLTFTKDAACEMKNRFLKQSCLRGKMPFFGTFHSFFFTILKEEFHISNQNIITKGKAISLVKKALKECNLWNSSIDVLGILKEFSNCINMNCPPGEYQSKLIPSGFYKVFDFYRQNKKELKLIDFDDMQSNVLELFKTNAEVLKKWQSRFEFVLLDEVQDINELQFTITKLLVNHHGNIFAVGDDDQSIYEFRGAVPKLMLSFEQEFYDLKTIVLSTNYRSEKQIVYVSSHFIQHNKNRFLKEYQSFYKSNGTVCYLQFEGEMEECEFILKEAYRNKSHSIGVLFRNKRDGDYISRYLELHHVCYYAKERFYFENRNEIISDVVSFLSLYFGISEMKETCGFHPDFSATHICPGSYYLLLNLFRKAFGYESYLKEKYKNDPLLFDEAKIMLDEIQNECKRFSVNDDIYEVLKYLNNMEIKENYRSNVKEEAQICLYTYHGSKGLEFDQVFCINVNEGMVPNPYNSNPEEERRMFYVAITRAKHKLYVCCIKKRGAKSYYPSVFINEMKY